MKKLLLLLLLAPFALSAKILIFTHHYNRPDFIVIQKKTFDAFLEDDYEFVVFNDASNDQMKNQIEQTCADLNLRCIRVPQNLHAQDNSFGARHVHGMKYAFETIGFSHNDIVVVIDSDVFLLKPFSIRTFLGDYDIASDLQGRTSSTAQVYHLSPLLLMMKMPILPNKTTLNFAGGHINGFACDNCAQTYYYLKNNPEVKTHFFKSVYIGAVKRPIGCPSCSNMTCLNCCCLLAANGFDPDDIRFIQGCPDDDVEFFLNRTFIHYRSGSNWNGKREDYHRMKTKALNDLVDARLAQVRS